MFHKKKNEISITLFLIVRIRLSALFDLSLLFEKKKVSMEEEMEEFK